MTDYDVPPAKKSLGQHWLNDQAALLAMCQAAGIEADDTVLEIGPGQGSLTKLLVEQAAEVVAVEFDRYLAEVLPSRVPASNLQVVSQDILSYDLTGLPADYKVVANIPYYLTSNLIRTLSESSNPPKTAALLIQKEVAERVNAKPGDMSLLSVTAQFYWQTSLGRVVKAGLFSPPPKVDSQILVLTRRDQPLFNGVDSRRFFQLVKAGFSGRRKTLRNSLSGGLRYEKSQIDELFAASAINLSRRAQTLSLKEWQTLYACLPD